MQSLCLLCLFSLMLLGLLFVPSSWAWVTGNPYNNPALFPSRSTTQCFMFDWLNPNKSNKPTTADDGAAEKKDADIFSNMFNHAAPVEEKAPPKEEPKVVEETKAAETLKAVEKAPAAAAPKEAAATEIQHGTVRWFDRIKGFGFIDPTDTKVEKTVFVHQSSLKCKGYRFLFDGEPVEYLEQVDEQGRFKAVDVTGPDRGDLRITEVRKRDKEQS